MASESSTVPPPTYTQHASSGLSVDHAAPLEPQILIVPMSNSVHFQKGYLGADDERASIEGELQIKGVDPGRWGKVTMSLRNTESAFDREVELSFTEIILFSCSVNSAASWPSTLPFAIPLTADTPQCIHTPHSSLSHTLTATLHPSNSVEPSISKSLTIHTRRYTPHTLTVDLAPRTVKSDIPTRVEVQVPRTIFKAGEPIPIYVTVPPPTRELVVDRGLRLRNVKAELVRVIRIRRQGYEIGPDSDFLSDSDASSDDPEDFPSNHFPQPSTSSQGLQVESYEGTSYKTIVARSGAPCRFHSSRPIRLRLVLHQSVISASPQPHPSDLPAGVYANYDHDSACASISQSTLLHGVTFRLRVHIAFVDMSNHTERASTLSVPITLLPPPAPLPEVDDSIGDDYHKKHDRPPAKTVRRDDADHPVPLYDTGVAGPSFSHSGEPPPFEEREAPPPFFSTEAEASTSSRLPTFLESEGDLFVPPTEDPSMSALLLPPMQGQIPGEGIIFGFPPSEQFDGHAQDLRRPSSPPPTMEMAARDPNVSELAILEVPEHAMEALGLALEQHEEAARAGELPPPPPAIDDPSDPPPSIDSEFRSAGGPHQERPPHSSVPTYEHPPPGLEPTAPAPDAQDTQGEPASHEHAPPPYLVPENVEEHEHTAGPPPYIDVMPEEH